MQIAILGPLAVTDDAGAPVQLAGSRLRTLLARLALDAGRPVSVAALADVVWGDTPPADVSNALQTLVSRLRRTIGATRVVQSPAGYLLAGADVDAARFRELLRRAADDPRRGDPAGAAEQFGAALALWRGPALVDVRDAANELARGADQLDAARLTAQLDHGEALLGFDSELVNVELLAAIVRDHPLDERAAALHLRALAVAGRSAEALQVYETLRARLADELGVDPSGELRELHLQLLRADDEPAPAQRRTNLKAQLTSFVGREDEVARIGKTLETNRLVTVVGPGGAGKTRLAAEVGHQILDTAPDGVWLSELATVTSGADVPQAVFASLGLREIHLFGDRRAQATGRDAVDKLRDALTDRGAVVVLDNCEHVIEAAAQLAETLLSECADLRILATSREPLGIFGETLVAIPPLGQPAPDASADDALSFPAVRLFADRATAVASGFAVDDETVASVVQIVRRLDGLPLAIELAAARLRSLPVDEVARRLGDRFRLLTGGSRTALPRHRTLRAVVEWSWELLTADERRFVELLAVFPAGVTAASAAAVQPQALPEDAAEDVLASLADKSLLQPIDGGRRMRMLETIREYGVDRLAERGELGGARERHARYFRELLAEAEPYLTTRDQLPWFELLTVERENIVAALRYYCDVEDADTALTMALTLGGYAMMLGDHSDVASWTGDAVAVSGGGDPQLRLMARAMLALNGTAAGTETGMPQEVLREVVLEMNKADLRRRTPMVSLMLPAMAFFAGEQELAQQWSDYAIEQGDAWTRAAALMFRANFAENAGDFARVRADLLDALHDFEEIGERWGLASTLRNYAQMVTLDGDLDGAREAYERALALARELRSTDDESWVFTRLADLALRQGDVAGAEAYLADPNLCDEEEGAPHDVLFRLAVVGELEYRLGRRDTGRARTAEAMRRMLAMPLAHPALSHIRTLTYMAAARIARWDDDVETAAEYGEQARSSALDTRDMPIIGFVTVLLADLVSDDDPAAAARRLGAATVLRGAEDATDLDVVALTRRLRDELGAEAFAAAYDEGRALPPSAALALVSGSVSEPTG